MSHTDGTWTQGLATSGLQVFIGASQFKDFAGLATFPAAPAAGLIYQVVPATDACKFFVDIMAFLRAAVYPTAALAQQQFGTAAAQPGPSAVSGTSGPLALQPGYPPITAANMATVGGTVGGAGVMSGVIPKGIQINSIDVIYQVLALAAAAATIGVTKTAFVNLVAPVVTNIIALAANGLPTVIGAQPQVTNVPVTTPAMIVPASPTEVIVNVNLTGGATGTVSFYGINVNYSYNFN
jgi:hypothetical protein